VTLVTAATPQSCSHRREEHRYELIGQILQIRPDRLELLIRHEDIQGFMPAMTMPFKVRDARLLQGRTPGDVVRATLVVDESDAHLRTLERTGSAPVPEAPRPSPLDILNPGDTAPDAVFIDQGGAIRRLSHWRGQVLAVTFIYTRCPVPNFCPLMDQHFKTAQDAIRQDQDLRERVRLLSVSFDPAYDRPAVLASRARQLAADPAIWSFLTGERQDIEAFASRFGVSIIREDAPAQEIVHSLRTAVIGADGRLSVILRGGEWTPRELISELRKALGRPAGR
jgi:protein SCO1/2